MIISPWMEKTRVLTLQPHELIALGTGVRLTALASDAIPRHVDLWVDPDFAPATDFSQAGDHVAIVMGGHFFRRCAPTLIERAGYRADLHAFGGPQYFLALDTAGLDERARLAFSAAYQCASEPPAEPIYP